MSERITKAATAVGADVTEEMLAKINKHTLHPLTAEEVYVYRVAMCDNKVDRDNEAFTRRALDKLAELFVGRTMLSDHKWTASGQVARIFDAKVEEADGETGTDERAVRLVASCYLPRTPQNADLITAIDAGIAKEVSVGCAVETCRCSVCGANKRKTWCEHRPGAEYEGAKCYVALDDPTDAYELSFVAVPAQPEAGVIKSYGAKRPEERGGNAGGEKVSARIRTAEAFAFAKNKKSKEERDNEQDYAQSVGAD